MVKRGVVRDAQQPGPERRVAAEVLEAVEGAQERVLADVLGVLRADDPSRHADDHRPVTVHELRERVELATRGEPHELGVVAVARRGRRQIPGHDPADGRGGPTVTSIATGRILV